MRIDEAATWICVLSTVFFIRKRKEGVIFFLVTRGKKKIVFSEILKNEFTDFQ